LTTGSRASGSEGREGARRWRRVRKRISGTTRRRVTEIAVTMMTVWVRFRWESGNMDMVVRAGRVGVVDAGVKLTAETKGLDVLGFGSRENETGRDI
jgi:hypothetical protein